MAWLRRIRLLLTRRRDSELREEMAFHREMLAADRGLSPASPEAERAFGNELLLRERARDVLGWRWLEDAWRDLGFGLRQMRRNRGFAAAAILTLALGVGATTAVFSVVNGVLLNPLPNPKPDQLVSLAETMPLQNLSAISYPDFLDWQRMNHSFSSLAAYRQTTTNLTGSGEAEHLDLMRVSASFFPTLGMRPAAGRNFTPQENHPGASPVVMLSYDFWQRHFGASPNALGRMITLDGVGYTVIGVAPRGFHLLFRRLQQPDVYVPIGGRPLPWLTNRDTHPGIGAIGRLRPGSTLQTARADMDTVARNLAAAYPVTNKNEGVTLTRLKQSIVGGTASTLWLLLAAVGFVLLISCANAAGLLLARSSSRSQEFAIRAALGAGRRRVIRQLLAESLALALIGGSLGTALAWWAAGALRTAAANELPRAQNIRMDDHALLTALALTILSGVLAGLAPATASVRKLTGSRQRATGRNRLRNALVVAEVALTVVLLAGAGLTIRSLVRLWNVNPGFNPHDLLTLYVAMPPGLSKSPPEAIRAALWHLTEAVAAVPGVEAASLTDGSVPMQGSSNTGFWIEGRPKPATSTGEPYAQTYYVGDGYFQTMGMHLDRGRSFKPSDTAHSPLVAVIDEGLAQTWFPHQNPIGKGLLSDNGNGTYQIIGVVGHVHQHALIESSSDAMPQIYMLARQLGDDIMPQLARSAGLVVRTQSSTFASVRSIHHAVDGMNRNQVAYNFESMDAIIADSLGTRRYTVGLLAAFAVLALFLAAVGLYGVIAYSVTQRTREIGIRMALGATRGDVLGQVVGRGVRLTLVGVAAGLTAAFGLTRFLASQLYGVRPYDPLTFASVAALLIAVALAACYIPARRAARTDPMVALRYE